MSPASHEWSLQQAVGQGPHGHLWRAVDGRRRTCLVELSEQPGDEPALILRARRIESLRHPFLLRAHGLVTVSDRLGIRYDDFDGVGLDGLLAQGAMPVACAIDLARKIARALHAAYDRKPRGGAAPGLVHGSLVPGDVLVDPAGAVRLFGLGMRPAASEGDGPSCLTDRPVAPWTAPEVLDGGAAGHAADVYALGAMLGQLLTGQSPPWASTSVEWHDAAVSGAAQAVQDLTGDPVLADLLVRTLAFDPAARPLAAEVEQTLARLHRKQEKGALARWCASAVPAARDDFELRRRMDAAADDGDDSLVDGAFDSLAAALVSGGAGAVDTDPGGIAVEDALTVHAPLHEEPVDDDVTLEAPPSRKLWEIRAQVGPGRPRPLEWEDPSREVTASVSPVDLREALPGELSEDAAEVLAMDPSREAPGTEELLLDPAEESVLEMSVLPPDDDDVDDDESAEDPAADDAPADDAAADDAAADDAAADDAGDDAEEPAAGDDPAGSAAAAEDTDDAYSDPELQSLFGDDAPAGAEGPSEGSTPDAASVAAQDAEGATATLPPADPEARMDEALDSLSAALAEHFGEEPAATPDADAAPGPAAPRPADGLAPTDPVLSSGSGRGLWVALGIAALVVLALLFWPRGDDRGDVTPMDAEPVQAGGAVETEDEPSAPTEASTAASPEAEATAEREAAAAAAEREAAAAAAAEREAAAAAAEREAAAAAAAEREAAAAAAAQVAAQRDAAAAAAEREAAAAQAAAEREAAAVDPLADASFSVQGQVDRVTFTGGGRHFSAGPLPPGSYAVEAAFAGTIIDLGNIDLAPGQSVTVSCSASFMQCRIR